MNKKYMIIAILGTLVLLLISKRSAFANILRDTLGIQEKPNNTGFDNPQFEQKMKELGWKSGWSWCVTYVKYIWYHLLKGEKRDRAMQLITANSQQTYNNFVNDTSGYFEVSRIPKVGSIAIWQKTTTSGHAGIVENIYSDSFDSIEGNISNKVARVKRKLDFNYIDSSGLKLRGFINLV